ncbi:MAG: hypothetical protein WBA74_21030 [Cyclobacteriaceae bacterium]
MQKLTNLLQTSLPKHICCLLFLIAFIGCDDEPELPPTEINGISSMEGYPGDQIFIYTKYYRESVIILLGDEQVLVYQNSLMPDTVSFTLDSDYQSGSLVIFASAEEFIDGYFRVFEEYQDINNQLTSIDEIESMDETKAYLISENSLYSMDTRTGESEKVYEAQDISGLSIGSDRRIMMIENRNQLLSSVDGGNTWSVVYEALDREIADYQTSSEKILVKTIGSPAEIEVLIGDIEGSDWQLISTLPAEVLPEEIELVYADNDAVILFDIRRFDLLLSDDLINWFVRDTPLASSVGGAGFIFQAKDLFTIYATNSTNRIYGTTDSGRSWNTGFLRFQDEASILNHHFFSDRNGMAITDKGGIIRTKDRGATWLINHLESDDILLAEFNDNDQSALLVARTASGRHQIVKVQF